MIVRKTSCTGNNRRVRARRRPGNVSPGNVLSRKVIVRERSCLGKVLFGKRLVCEMSVRESDCPGNVRYPLEMSEDREMVAIHHVVEDEMWLLYITNKKSSLLTLIK